MQLRPAKKSPKMHALLVLRQNMLGAYSASIWKIPTTPKLYLKNKQLKQTFSPTVLIYPSSKISFWHITVLTIGLITAVHSFNLIWQVANLVFMFSTSCGVFRKKCETHFLHFSHHYLRFWRRWKVDWLFTIYE